MGFMNEKVKGCVHDKAIDAINEAAIGAIIGSRNPPSCFFIFYFTVSFPPSIDRPDFSSGSTLLIISSISLFEMNKVNSFPALTTPFLLFFLSNLSDTDKVPLVSNLGKTSLARGTARSSNPILLFFLSFY